MEQVQGLKLPDLEVEEVLGIAEALCKTLDRAAARLAFDNEPAGFTAAMEALANKTPGDKTPANKTPGEES